MVTLTFSDELAERLQRIATREGRSVEDVVRDMVEHYPPAYEGEMADEPRPGSGAALLKSALAANIRIGHDITERSRQILDNEFPKYLMERMSRPAIDDESE